MNAIQSNSFSEELKELINKHSVENASGTPDFLLANYLMGCLSVFATTTQARDKWYGISGANDPEPTSPPTEP